MGVLHNNIGTILFCYDIPTTNTIQEAAVISNEPLCPMILTMCMCVCFRCEGRQQQLPGPVGLHQWYHRSDGTRVQGTQLSGIPALLWGNAVMWPEVICTRYLFCFVLFLVQSVQLLLLCLWKREKRERLYTHFSYMRGMTLVSFAHKFSI